MNRIGSIFALLCVVGFAGVAAGQLGPSSPGREPNAVTGAPTPDSVDVSGSNVIEKLGQFAAADTVFRDEQDNVVRFGDYLNKGKPIILQIGYFDCPMLCDLISRGMVKALKDIKLDQGSEFDVLYLSIDPNESAGLARQKRMTLGRELGLPPGAAGYHLLTGEESEIKRLTDSVGFGYQYVADVNEYAHPAVLIILAPDGKITRYLYGMDYDPQVMRLSLVEASDGTVGSTLDRLILTCFRFNHSTGKYQVIAFRLMQGAAALTVIIGAAILLPIWIKSYRQAKRQKLAEGGAGHD